MVLSQVTCFTAFREARPNKSCDMQDGQVSLPSTINAFTFPAKLWRMVNNPKSNAVHWSDSGDVIFIDRQIFETQILARQSKPSENLDTFRAKHFTSFIRQLNLYGFSRASWVMREEGVPYPFFHPNFKRGQPELLKNLERRTVKNKNKWKAGLSAPSKLRGRPRRKYELGTGHPQADDMLLLMGESRPDVSPDLSPVSPGDTMHSPLLASNMEEDGAMAVADVIPGEGTCQYFNRAPGSSALAAQQTTQCYSSCSFFPPTYSEHFSAPQWSNYSCGDQCYIHPNNPSSYLQLPKPNFQQGQNPAMSAGYSENPPFPANLQRLLNMADTSAYSDLTYGIFEHPPQHAFCLPDLDPLDMTEVLVDDDWVNEVAGLEPLVRGRMSDASPGSTSMAPRIQDLIAIIS
ncbi:uncharacterized protein ACB058_010681 [Synchiropus picturatus]